MKRDELDVNKFQKFVNKVILLIYFFCFFFLIKNCSFYFDVYIGYNVCLKCIYFNC